MTALGAQAGLLTVVGGDEAGQSFGRLLGAASVAPHIHTDPALATTVKVRVIGRRQQMLRVDFDSQPHGEVLLEHLGHYESLLPNYDLVVLSDYGKGGLTHITRMIELAREADKPILVDPKGDDYSRYAGATIVTPIVRSCAKSSAAGGARQIWPVVRKSFGAPSVSRHSC
jgi:rfaE bifunctional protein kinase chain/domain